MEDLNKPYLPASEEVKKAEDTMTNKQRLLSSMREYNSKVLGRPDFVESEIDGDHKRVFGKVKGHEMEINLKKTEDGMVELESVLVNGTKLDSETAQKVWEKYSTGMNDIRKEDIEEAHQEVIEAGNSEAMDAAVKDILN